MAARLSPDQLDRALELQSRHYTQAKIAQELEVQRETVSRALARHNRRAIEVLTKRLAATKGQQVDQLAKVAAEAYAAWERSQLDAEVIRTSEQTDTTTVEVNNVETTTTKTRTKSDAMVKGQTGDPRFLHLVVEAMADVRDILGIGVVGKEQGETVKDVWGEAKDAAESYQPALAPATTEVGQPASPPPGLPR